MRQKAFILVVFFLAFAFSSNVFAYNTTTVYSYNQKKVDTFAWPFGIDCSVISGATSSLCSLVPGNVTNYYNFTTLQIGG